MTRYTEVIPLPVNRRRRAWAAVLIAVLAIVAVVVIVGLNRGGADDAFWCDRTGDVQRVHHDDECIGVSLDAPYLPADKPLTTVLKAIANQNAQVTAAAVNAPANYYVDIAYVVPLPYRDQGLTTTESVVHQLEGALIRQTLNNALTDPGRPPRIRLQIANTGWDSWAWERVAGQLRKLKENGRLVAVTGFGPSLDTTRQLLTRLADAGLATLGSIFTSDTFHGRLGGDKSIPVRRIAPTNQDEIAAALHYLPKLSSAARMVLVAASDPNNVDSYTKTLIASFQKQNTLATDLEFFDPGSPAYNSTLDGIASRICSDTAIDAVYFAGRYAPAAHLAGEIGRRCAADRRIRILTGDAVNAELSSIPDPTEEWTTLRDSLASGKVELYYTGLAHPDQWKDFPGTAPAAEMHTLAEGMSRLTHTELYPLDDGDAMMAYDSILTLIKVIQQVASGLGTVDPKISDLQHLSNGFLDIAATSPVCGASGPISIVRDEAEGSGQVGNTVNKPIPLARIVVSADRTQMHAEFAGLYYPAGARAWNGVCGFPR